MAELKTKATAVSVESFLDSKAPDGPLRKDCNTLIGIMKKVTGSAPKMYIKKLEDVDLAVLEDIIKKAVDHVKKKYPGK